MNQYIWQHKEWPFFTWQNDQLLSPLNQCNFKRGQLLGRVASLGMDHGREAQAEVLVAEVLQTSAIEGHTLNPDSVRSSVARRLGLPDAGLSREDLYTDGLVEVLLDATVNSDQLLTVERLHGWQAALFPTGYSGLRRLITVDFRGKEPMQVVSGPIGREKIRYEAMPGVQVTDEIDAFLFWWHEKQGTLEGILRAAIAGFWFVSIHPYEDGNGRLARALTDMALAQDEKMSTRYYSFSAQIIEERNEYYDVLERCQKRGLDITDWLLWFLGCFERTINRSEKLIAKVLLKSEFWKRHSQTPLTIRQRKVVNRLLEAGPDAFEGGLTTRKYVGMTKASRATSYREITDLVKKGILLQNPGQGRSVSYGLVWE